jgi:outer membrane protein TolC
LDLRFNPAVVTRFSFGLHQPLLNGFGRQSNERFIRVARNNTETSEEVFRQQVISTIVQVESAYWDLAALAENVRVATQSLEVARRLLNDNRLRVEIGTMSPLEVTAAEAEVAARTRDLTLSETNLQLQEQTLKNFLSRRSSPTLDAASIALTDRLPEPKDTDLPDIRVALESALKNRPELRQAAGNLKNQEIANQFTKSSLRPALAVFGLYAGAGLQGESAQGSTGAGDALLQAFQGDYPEYGGGMSFNLPIRNRVAQADNLRAQLEDRQLRLGFQRSQNQAALEVRKAIIGLIQGKAQVEAAHQAVRLAQEIWTGEQNRLEAGVSTSYQVILRERDFVASRQAEVSATVGYAKALVEVDRAMGVTLNRREILIEDALSGSLSRSPVPVSAAAGTGKKSE